MDLEPQKVVDEILNPILNKLYTSHTKAVDYKSPEELKQIIDFSLPDQTTSIDLKDIKQLIQNTFEFTPSTQHPFQFNYLYSKPDFVGILGDWIISLINSNVHTYEASPVFSMAEVELIKNLAAIVGLGEDADGIFCPGGSYSNMMAVFLAKNRCIENEDIKEKELVIFKSEQAHYSIDKVATLLGIKPDNICRVSCDKKGRMQIRSLRRQIEGCLSADKKPACVCATSGTTVLGGFDPLDEISEALSDYGRIWLHVDAAWGGAVLMSAQYRHLMKGIERADSMTWDFHKALNAPILCSAFLVRSAISIKSMFHVYDSYLFHDSEPLRQYDLGRKTAQCGRRGDAFKLWLMWKVRGRSYFESRVDKSFKVTSEAIKLIKERTAFWLYDENPAFWNVCFYFVPEHLRHKDGIKACSEREKLQLQAVTKQLYKSLNKDGRVLVNYAEINGDPPFLRLIFGNPELSSEQIKDVFDIIESTGNIII